MGKKPSEFSVRLDLEIKTAAAEAAKQDLYTSLNSLIVLLLDAALAYRGREGKLHNDLKLINERDWAEFERWKKSRDEPATDSTTPRKRPSKTA